MSSHSRSSAHSRRHRSLPRLVWQFRGWCTGGDRRRCRASTTRRTPSHGRSRREALGQSFGTAILSPCWLNHFRTCHSVARRAEAAAASSTRDEMPSLANTCERWVCTVRREMRQARADLGVGQAFHHELDDGVFGGGEGVPADGGSAERPRTRRTQSGRSHRGDDATEPTAGPGTLVDVRRVEEERDALARRCLPERAARRCPPRRVLAAGPNRRVRWSPWRAGRRRRPPVPRVERIASRPLRAVATRLRLEGCHDHLGEVRLSGGEGGMNEFDVPQPGLGADVEALEGVRVGRLRHGPRQCRVPVGGGDEDPQPRDRWPGRLEPAQLQVRCRRGRPVRGGPG